MRRERNETDFLCISRNGDTVCHMIAWAWQQPGVTAVTAECLDDNVGSIKVLEKAGMHRLPAEGNMLKWKTRKYW